MPPLPRTMWQLEQLPFPVKNRSPAAASPAAGWSAAGALNTSTKATSASSSASGIVNGGIAVLGIPLRIKSRIAACDAARGRRMSTMRRAVAAAGAVGPVAADAARFVGSPASLERLRERGGTRARERGGHQQECSRHVTRHRGSVNRGTTRATTPPLGRDTIGVLDPIQLRQYQSDQSSAMICTAVTGGGRFRCTRLDPTRTAMIGETLGQYRIESRLGSGGMGVVYRAHDERLHRSVAIKLIGAEGRGSTPDERARLLDEARAASHLTHPHICTVYEVGELDGRVFIAMEFVEGQPLSQLVPADGLPAETVVRYGEQIAAALAHAHERGVIHRDLKTANVAVGPGGAAKILDFGLARRTTTRAAEEATQANTMADPGVLIGTLAYVAPEVLLGQRCRRPHRHLGARGRPVRAGHRSTALPGPQRIRPHRRDSPIAGAAVSGARSADPSRDHPALPRQGTGAALPASRRSPRGARGDPLGPHRRAASRSRRETPALGMDRRNRRTRDRRRGARGMAALAESRGRTATRRRPAAG